MSMQKVLVPAVVALLAIGLSGCVADGSDRRPDPTDAATADVADNSPADVAVLVVDDFRLTAPASPAGPLTGNCVTSANVVGSGGAGDDLQLDDRTHGELVYQVLRDQLGTLVAAVGGAMPQTTATTAPALGDGPERTVETTAEWAYPDGGQSYRIRLVAVDAAGYTTANVIDGIAASMSALTRERFRRFALNLSFVVLPCDPMTLLTTTNQQALLQTYLTLLGTDDSMLSALETILSISIPNVDATTIAQLLPDIQTAALTDDRLLPLRNCLIDAAYRQVAEEGPGKDTGMAQQLRADQAWDGFRASWPTVGGDGVAVVTVGAAGNGIKCGDADRVTFEFPFAPALWDFVVSVSADDFAGGVMSYSNSGEVKLAGDGPLALLPGSHGTSFAAPRLSAFEAIYLLRTGQVQCGGDQPTLGYVDTSALQPAPSPGPLPWHNEDKTLWPSHCSDFSSMSGA